MGHDYLDPIARNFVITPAGRLVAVDVEELMPDQLLGSGVAKAVLRTPGARRERLLAGIRRTAGLDLAPVMPFVELPFLAGWTKRALLKGRAKLVRPELFEPFRRAVRKRSAQRGEAERCPLACRSERSAGAAASRCTLPFWIR